MSWRAIEQALAGPALPRVPFFLGAIEVGSVASVHLPALAGLAPQLEVGEAAVRLVARASERDRLLADINATLRRQGLIRAWRDETYAVVDPRTLRRLARIERASSRFWGTLTFGAHATGYVPGPDGRPAALWIARRSPHKATDPGLLDNLVGGGVPDGQSPLQTLVREGWEEAGLLPQQLGAAQRGRIVCLARDIPEGFQHEWLHAFDIALPAHVVPVNQDGEVAAFELLPPAQALARAAAGEMTVDAALVTLDFALRHRLLPAARQAVLQRRSAALWVQRPAAAPRAAYPFGD